MQNSHTKQLTEGKLKKETYAQYKDDNIHRGNYDFKTKRMLKNRTSKK